MVRLTAPAPKPVVLYIDSQGGPGFHYHFIKDKHLFDQIDTSHKTVHVGGVIGMDESTAPSHGFGSCTVDVITDSGPITMRLTNCLYVPGMESNVFNVWHALHAHNIKPIIDKTKSHLLFDDGSQIPMLSDFTVRVVKHTAQVRAVSASVINRGPERPRCPLEHERVLGSYECARADGRVVPVTQTHKCSESRNRSRSPFLTGRGRLA